MAQQIYNVSVTLGDGSTVYTKFVAMTDQQAQLLLSYINICVANGYNCTAGSVTAQENPISYGAFCSNIVNNFSIFGSNTPNLGN